MNRTKQSEIVKVMVASLTYEYVSSAIASVQTFSVIFNLNKNVSIQTD